MLITCFHVYHVCVRVWLPVCLCMSIANTYTGEHCNCCRVVRLKVRLPCSQEQSWMFLWEKKRKRTRNRVSEWARKRSSVQHPHAELLLWASGTHSHMSHLCLICLWDSCEEGGIPPFHPFQNIFTHLPQKCNKFTHILTSTNSPTTHSVLTHLRRCFWWWWTRQIWHSQLVNVTLLQSRIEAFQLLCQPIM